MSCSKYTISGLSKGCRDSLGGVVKCWVSTDLNIPTVNASIGADGSFTHIDTSIATYTEFKPFEFFKNTGSMTTTANISETAGTSFSTELSLQFMKADAAKRLEFMGLVMDETVVIVKDANKKYWLLGENEGVAASAGTVVSGTAAADLNGYTITLKDDSLEAPREIKDSSFLAALESIVITPPAQ